MEGYKFRSCHNLKTLIYQFDSRLNLMIQNIVKEKNINIRELIAKLLFISSNIFLFIIYIYHLIDYYDGGDGGVSSGEPRAYPLTDLIFIEVLFFMFLILGGMIFFIAYILPKKWVLKSLSYIEISFLVLLIAIHFIFDDFGYYTFAAHFQRIILAFMIGYVFIYLFYLLCNSIWDIRDRTPKRVKKSFFKQNYDFKRRLNIP